MYVYVYIYIYIYIYIHICLPEMRPIPLLRLSLPRFLDSRLLGNSLWTREFNPLKLTLCWSQALRSPES